MSKLAGLHVDLVDELAGGRHDDRLGLLLLAEGAGGRAVRHQLLQDGQEEGRLAGGGVEWEELHKARHRQVTSSSRHSQAG